MSTPLLPCRVSRGYICHLTGRTHLGLAEIKCSGDLDATSARQISTEVELFLEFGQLFVGEIGARRATAIRQTVRRGRDADHPRRRR